MPLAADSPLHAVTRDILNASTGPDPLDRVRAVLDDYTQRFHIAGGLVHEEESDELLLHASPNLTIYHITLTPGLQYPPHEHRMDALIGIYAGSETNFVYTLASDELEAPQRQDYFAPAVLQMTPDTVHSVANTGNARSGALHVYLGDLPATRRQMWNPDSNRAELFEDERYMAGARPVG
jgi:predicted metal-dependent enzyme (double-stranded beta helix superfamily)